MLQNKTKSIEAPITTGEYEGTYVSLINGKTDADTGLRFKLNNGRIITAWINNARTVFKDEKTEEDYTSEDLFFIGLKRQLKLYGEDVSSLDVLEVCKETQVKLWVIYDEPYTNVYTRVPKGFDKATLDI
jgi:hypothetical protein